MLQRLAKTGQLEEPVFGFYLGDGTSGELVLGGVNREHVDGDFHFVDLNLAAWWSVPLETIHVGRQRIKATQSVILDSGTSLLVGPEDSPGVRCLVEVPIELRSGEGSGRALGTSAFCGAGCLAQLALREHCGSTPHPLLTHMVFGVNSW